MKKPVPKKEIWKTIPGYENYAASNKGRIKRIKASQRYKAGHILKPGKINSGYLRISLCGSNHRRISHTIHRLVLLAFKGPSPLPVNHKNGIKTDNRLENLEYCTASENMKHAIDTGLFSALGSSNPNSIFTEEDVHKIDKLFAEGMTQTKIAKFYGTSHQNISLIIQRRRWKHVPQLWKRLKKCPDCQGTGAAPPDGLEGRGLEDDCPTCFGTGKA